MVNSFIDILSVNTSKELNFSVAYFKLCSLYNTTVPRQDIIKRNISKQFSEIDSRNYYNLQL